MKLKENGKLIMSYMRRTHSVSALTIFSSFFFCNAQPHYLHIALTTQLNNPVGLVGHWGKRT